MFSFKKKTICVLNNTCQLYLHFHQIYYDFSNLKTMSFKYIYMYVNINWHLIVKITFLCILSPICILHSSNNYRSLIKVLSNIILTCRSPPCYKTQSIVNWMNIHIKSYVWVKTPIVIALMNVDIVTHLSEIFLVLDLCNIYVIFIIFMIC